MGIPASLGVSASGLPAAGDQANAVLSGTIGAVGPTAPFAFRGPMNLALWNSLAHTLGTTAASLNITVDDATGLAAGTSVNSVNVPPGTTLASVNAGAKTGVLKLPPQTFWGLLTPNGRTITALGLGNALLGSTVTGPGIPAATTVDQIVRASVLPNVQGNGRVDGIVRLTNLPTAFPATVNAQPFVFQPTANAILVTGNDAAATFTDAAAVCAATVQLERSFDGGSTWLCCNVGGNGGLAQYVNFSSVQLTFGDPERQVLYRFNCIAFASGIINYRVSATGAAAESLAIATSI